MAGLVRGAGSEGLKLVLEVLVGLIELELGTLYELAVLVELDNVGLGNRHEVELEPHVGVGGATLQVEELERVVGAASEGVAVEARNIPPRILELAFQRAICGIVNADVARLEVNGQISTGVDTANVAHEDIVNEHPDVVVSGELKGHGLVSVRFAILRLHEARRHGEAEIMVEGSVVLRRNAVRDEFAVLFLEYLIGRIEGEELAY